jgi:hypothetical protein
VQSFLRVLGLTATLSLAPASADITGVVFTDTNGNGVRDAGESGIARVVVSNQDTVVLTDDRGTFRLTNPGTGVVFVSIPDGYRAVGNFWRLADTNAPLAFALAPRPAKSEVRFVHASDTHISSASLARTQRLRQLVDSIAPDLLLITGDLVRDALRVPEAEATGYYDLFLRERTAFKTPVFTAPGNHEIFGIERDSSHVPATHPLYGRKMYRHYFGPDYYSFTLGGVHFVALNTVDINDQSYYGNVDSTQLAWLRRDLAIIPEAMPVVTFNHIPLASSFPALGGYQAGGLAPTLITVGGRTLLRHSVSNAGEVLGILRARPLVLALGGHFHATEQIEYEIEGVKTRFNQQSAVIAPPRTAGLQFISGVTLYRAKDGVIDSGRFFALDTPGQDGSAGAARLGGTRPEPN